MYLIRALRDAFSKIDSKSLVRPSLNTCKQRLKRWNSACCENNDGLKPVNVTFRCNTVCLPKFSSDAEVALCFTCGLMQA